MQHTVCRAKHKVTRTGKSERREYATCWRRNIERWALYMKGGDICHAFVGRARHGNHTSVAITRYRCNEPNDRVDVLSRNACRLIQGTPSEVADVAPFSREYDSQSRFLIHCQCLKTIGAGSLCLKSPDLDA
jgi:hypothetical protein